MRLDDLLRDDPPEALGDWPRAARAALDALTARGVAELPRAPGVGWRALAQWLHRAALAASPGRWWPCVLLDAAHAGASRAWWGAAHGGWVATDLAPGDLPDVLSRAASVGHLAVLHVGGDELALPDGVADALARSRAWHALVVDPTLEHARAELVARMASSSPVTLYGEWGAGKRRLAAWACARAGLAPLAALDVRHAQRAPGQGAIWPEVTALGAPELAALRDALRRFEPTRGLFPAPRRAPASRQGLPAELDALVGHSPPLVDALALIARLAPSDLPILLQGEPGTGKELAARAIHDLSGRPGPFVALDMGALGEGLAESTLFGHKKGAFTGAHEARLGAMRAAHGGTLLLDEIGNLPLDLQVKLLRALQERAVTPVGEDLPVPVDVRVLAATNADLESATRAGTFRRDLLGRLRVAQITLPPLRARLEDLDALARAYLRARHPERDVDPWCTPALRARLLDHPWPGNVRELHNVLSVACALADPGPLDLAHLDARWSTDDARAPVVVTHSGDALPARPDALPDDLWRRVTLGACRVAPLRERPLHALDALVAHALRGRPATRSAWRALRDHPWWGNLDELDRLADALEASPPGLLDHDALTRVAPEVALATTSAPFTVLLSPAPRGDTLTGLTWEVSTSGAVLGRAASLETTRARARSGDLRARGHLERVSSLADPSSITCVGLDFLPRLSRLSALVSRGPDGLRVVAFEGLRLRALARPLDATEWAPVTDASLDLGRAGALRFESARSGELYLQLYLVESDALTPYAQAILDAHAAASSGQDATLSMLGGDAAPANTRSNRLYLWTLSRVEVEALSDLVDAYPGGSLAHHTARHLDALAARPEVARLHDYLAAAPRASQYLGRLYTHPPNAALRDALRARADRREDQDAWAAALPNALRKILRG
jgi:DNA-binding NtrC family response regulator